MANRKHLIRVVTTAGDTTGFSEFVAGSTDGGPLIPSFTTTQRNAISSATTGEVIFNSSTSKLQVYNGSSWGVAINVSTPVSIQNGGTGGTTLADAQTNLGIITLQDASDEALALAIALG